VQKVVWFDRIPVVAVKPSALAFAFGSRTNLVPNGLVGGTLVVTAVLSSASVSAAIRASRNVV
jgi:hypothetical protein